MVSFSWFNVSTMQHNAHTITHDAMSFRRVNTAKYDYK